MPQYFFQSFNRLYINLYLDLIVLSIFVLFLRIPILIANENDYYSTSKGKFLKKIYKPIII